MRLTKKHIGQCFDTRGGDGSWCYQLLDIKGKKLLFYSWPSERFEIDTNRLNDWRAVSQFKKFSDKQINKAWKTARVSPYV